VGKISKGIFNTVTREMTENIHTTSLGALRALRENTYILSYPKYTGYNCYILLSNRGGISISAAATAVSEMLIVKYNVGLLSEDKLASHYCIKIPGWCPCVLLSDSLEAKDIATDYLLIIYLSDVEEKG